MQTNVLQFHFWLALLPLHLHARVCECFANISFSSIISMRWSNSRSVKFEIIGIAMGIYVMQLARSALIKLFNIGYIRFKCVVYSKNLHHMYVVTMFYLQFLMNLNQRWTYRLCYLAYWILIEDFPFKILWVWVFNCLDAISLFIFSFWFSQMIRLFVSLKNYLESFLSTHFFVCKDFYRTRFRPALFVLCTFFHLSIINVCVTKFIVSSVLFNEISIRHFYAKHIHARTHARTHAHNS